MLLDATAPLPTCQAQNVAQGLRDKRQILLPPLSPPRPPQPPTCVHTPGLLHPPWGLIPPSLSLTPIPHQACSQPFQVPQNRHTTLPQHPQPQVFPLPPPKPRPTCALRSLRLSDRFRVPLQPGSCSDSLPGAISSSVMPASCRHVCVHVCVCMCVC